MALDGNTWVMLSTGRGFSPPTQWYAGLFSGSKATLLGDVNGDGRADLVVVDDTTTAVMLSSEQLPWPFTPGPGFSGPAQWSGEPSGVPFFGSKVTLLGDVNGGGRADLVAVNDNDTWVSLSSEQLPFTSHPGFSAPARWSGERFFGSKATLLGDVTGDGRADLVAVNDNDTWVMLSTGSGFSAPAQWSGARFFGSKVTLLGDVTGDGRADLVAVNVFSTDPPSDGGEGEGEGEGEG
jgi:FG-GAP-like repeat